MFMCAPSIDPSQTIAMRLIASPLRLLHLPIVVTPRLHPHRWSVDWIGRSTLNRVLTSDRNRKSFPRLPIAFSPIQSRPSILPRCIQRLSLFSPDRCPSLRSPINRKSFPPISDWSQVLLPIPRSHCPSDWVRAVDLAFGSNGQR